jgi:hypothetical protein
MPYIIVQRAGQSYVNVTGSAAQPVRRAQKEKSGRAGDMGRLVKAVLALVVLGLLGLAGYAYLGDLSPTQTQITQPVVLDAP